MKQCGLKEDMHLLCKPYVVKSIPYILIFTFIILMNTACNRQDNFPSANNANIHIAADTPLHTVADIPLPAGYSRIALHDSFAVWLRNFPLRKDKTVYLYNHHPTAGKEMHYAVLDLSTGDKDLQQCADCIMRLMAEYYFSVKKYHLISFRGGDGSIYSFQKYLAQNNLPCTHNNLLHYLNIVFSYCGTYTIESMTKKKDITSIMPGDVLVHAGSPGHAMIVMDAAVNRDNEKIFVLAQGFMPAQDMHIVINPADGSISPWYKAVADKNIITPGWAFTPDEYKSFIQ